MLVAIKRKRKKTKRQSRRRGRNEASVVLFKEVNVLVELDANFLMMSK